MDNQLLLSICIPTNGVVEWVIPVVESIYAQNVDMNLFEVVVTDNGGKNDLKEALSQHKYPNFHYYQTTAQGFMNQIDAFEKCSGLFCKMLNHRSRMLPGSISNLIGIVEKYKDTRPIIYCADGHAKGGELIECDNIDEFVGCMSYWISWSAGTGAWRSDIVDIRQKQINKMFPHTVFLFGLREESKYVIWNCEYETMANDAGKGGYDVFRTFGVTLLDILSELRIHNRISVDSFLSVKEDLLFFLQKIYFCEVIMPTDHTYSICDIAKNLSVYYGRYSYWKIVFLSLMKAPYAYFKLFLKKMIWRS